MTLNLSLPGHEELKPRITVFGVGGAGGNAVNNMIEKELDGVEFVVANTDAQALQQARAEAKIQMGLKVTEGLGAGARATVGAAAAEESIEQIVDHLAGAHMCFITAGMGGGTGTGAAPIIAQAARELGVLTVGVVTKPFQFEGGKRMKQADAGIEALQKVVDTLIIIPNQNLFRLANENTTFTEAFALADDVLYQGVKGVTDLMVRPGLINLDFADVRAVMDEMGKAMMGTGEADGENRAIQAAEKAIANPLLDEISLEGAKGVLINITGGYDLTLFELDEAANKIREKVDSEANIIVGSTLDTGMEGRMRVSVVATGIDAAVSNADTPLPRRSMAAPLTPAAAAPATAAEPVQEVPIEVIAATEEQPEFEELSREEPVEFDFVPQAEPEVAEVEAVDDLPPPAYTPRPEPVLTEADSFVAPRAPASVPPGTPTPEAMARLQAAVGHTGNRPAQTAPTQAQPVQAQPQARPTQVRPPQDPQQAVAAEGEKPRFGINSLINRMTGAQADAAQKAPRAQPQVTALHQEPEANEDQERIEIPAFLRRQAN